MIHFHENSWNLSDAKEFKFRDNPIYDHFNRTLWKTVDELGRRRVEALANEIDRRSLDAATNCVKGLEVRDGEGPKGKVTGEYILKKNKGKDQNLTSAHYRPFSFEIVH